MTTETAKFFDHLQSNCNIVPKSACRHRDPDTTKPCAEVSPAGGVLFCVHYSDENRSKVAKMLLEDN